MLATGTRIPRLVQLQWNRFYSREDNMIRFVNCSPKFVWYSQHANGSASTSYIALKNALESASVSYYLSSTSSLSWNLRQHRLTTRLALAYCTNESHAFYPTRNP